MTDGGCPSFISTWAPFAGTQPLWPLFPSVWPRLSKLSTAVPVTPGAYCQGRTRSPFLQHKGYGFKDPGRYPYCVCAAREDTRRRDVGGRHRRDARWGPPPVQLGHPLPSPQPGEPYIGSSVPALGNRVIYQGGAARRADTTQLFARSGTAKRKQPWAGAGFGRDAGLGGGRQRDSSAGGTRFVGTLAICRCIPPRAAGHGDAGIKPDSAGREAPWLNHPGLCAFPAAPAPAVGWLCPASACKTP